MKNKNRLIQRSIIAIFVLLYAFVSLISTIHVIDFFEMSNPHWLAVSLAIAFEFGAAASLAAIVVGEKTNKAIVWGLFFILTAFQMQGNMWYAYVNLEDYSSWMELFYLNEMELIEQKRVLALVSGAVLPLVALGFIKSLVDYIKPEEDKPEIIPILTGPTGPNGPDDSGLGDGGPGEESEFEEEVEEVIEEVLTPLVNEPTTPSPLVEKEKELKDKYKEERAKQSAIKDPEVNADIETFGEPLNIEVKDDVNTFGENLKKKEVVPPIDNSLQQKPRPKSRTAQ